MSTLGLPDMPQEVVDMVISYFALDRALLKTCSLVARSWVRASHRHLFHTIVLDLEQTSIYAFLQFAAACPEAAKMVRSLRIASGDSDQSQLDPFIFVDLLAALPSLHRLSLKDVMLYSYPSAKPLFNATTENMQKTFSLDYLQLDCGVVIVEELVRTLFQFSRIVSTVGHLALVAHIVDNNSLDAINTTLGSTSYAALVEGKWKVASLGLTRSVVQGTLSAVQDALFALLTRILDPHALNALALCAGVGTLVTPKMDNAFGTFLRTACKDVSTLEFDVTAQIGGWKAYGVVMDACPALDAVILSLACAPPAKAAEEYTAMTGFPTSMIKYIPRTIRVLTLSFDGDTRYKSRWPRKYGLIGTWLQRIDHARAEKALVSMIGKNKDFEAIEVVLSRGLGEIEVRVAHEVRGVLGRARQVKQVLTFPKSRARGRERLSADLDLDDDDL